MYSNNIKPLMTGVAGNKGKPINQNRSINADKPANKEFKLSPLTTDFKAKATSNQNKSIAGKSTMLQNLNGNSHDANENIMVNKPSGKCRLFVGNINNDMTDEELKTMFKDYGPTTEVFVSNRGFGFIKLESKFMADKAKHELDGTTYKNKMIRVRIATTGTALKVLNLSPHVTNEILVKAFSVFGPLDSAVVVADERGKSVGEGIVEFSRKNQAQVAMQKINEGVFLLTNSLKPVVVEPYETKDFEEGVAEKTVNKTAAYLKETEKDPKFVQPGSFEYDYGNKWKALYQQEKIQRELLEKKIVEDREALENDMESTLHEHQTMLMRQDLMRRQEELQRMEEARFHFIKQKEDKTDRRSDMNMFQPSYNSFQQSFGNKGQFQLSGNSDMNKGEKLNLRGNLFSSHDGFGLSQQQLGGGGMGNNASGNLQNSPNLLSAKVGGPNNPSSSSLPSNNTNNQTSLSTNTPNKGNIPSSGIKPLFPLLPQQHQQQQQQMAQQQQNRMQMPPMGPHHFGPGGAMRPNGPPMPLMQSTPGMGHPHHSQQFPFGAAGPRMMMMGDDFMNDNHKRVRRF